MAMLAFASLADAMVHLSRTLLRQPSWIPVVAEPSSVGSTFGESPRPTKECIGLSFQIDDPRAVLIERPSRPINIPYTFANILWTVARSDRADVNHTSRSRVLL